MKAHSFATRWAALGLALLAQSLLPGAQAQTPPDSVGRDLVGNKCNSCHVLAQRVGGGYTPQGWGTVMRMMTNHGVAISPAELPAMVDYLAKTFPQRPRPAAVLLPGATQVSMQAWAAGTPGSRPHDPLATRDGLLWYTGQMTNKLGRVDPATGAVQEFPLKTPHSGPHGLVEDATGNIWYTANTGALIGKLNPANGEVTEYPLPDPTIRDPHTLIFDQAGMLWFTAQAGNRIGRLDPQTGQIQLLTPPTANSRPYGMAVDSKGTVFYVAFGTNKVGAVDPKTLQIREYTLPNAASRPRRLTVTKDDMVWYVDFSRGFIGKLNPANGQVTELASPSGPRSQPYGISTIGNAIWYSESGTEPNTVVRLDPGTGQFQSWPIPGGGDIVRNTSVTPDGGFVLANSLTNEVTLVKVVK